MPAAALPSRWRASRSTRTLVAEMLGLSSRGAVSVCRFRYDGFPEPVIDVGKVRPMLWLRADVEACQASRS